MFSPSTSETFCFAPVSRFLLLLRFSLPFQILQRYQPMLCTANVPTEFPLKIAPHLHELRANDPILVPGESHTGGRSMLIKEKQ